MNIHSDKEMMLCVKLRDELCVCREEASLIADNEYS